MTDVQVGEQNQVVDDDGREPLSIQYHPIQDKSIQLPFTAHLKQKDGVSITVLDANM